MKDTRSLQLPVNPKKSFFLWGPRQTGKTTLLRQTYPDALRINLLKTDELIRYLRQPSLLREELEQLEHKPFVIIDEIQKVPSLLDEIHYLIEERGLVFGLCGSSARKVRRGHANLLGGRAVRYELLGLGAKELGGDFNLHQFVNAGPQPDHYASSNAKEFIRSYVDDYLREEILEEGLTRNIPIFSDFLRVAAIGDTEVLNMSKVARETGVAVSTVRDHYQILVDTLMGAFLPAFTLRQKRRMTMAPKFYFRDVGVVNNLARRSTIVEGSELFGKAFENWVFHELTIHTRYSGLHYDLSYWRLSSGIEVDFILGNGDIAIEAKGKSRTTQDDLKGLRQFKMDHPEVKHRILVCTDAKCRKTEDGIEIITYSDFIEHLWSNKWF